MRPREDAETRFRRMVRRIRLGCWIWMGGRDHRGYGRFRYDGRSQLAHRWAYERAWSEHGWKEGWALLTPELELDHTCVNRWCVNPEHLEPVSHADNIFLRDQRRRQKRLEQEIYGSELRHQAAALL